MRKPSAKSQQIIDLLKEGVRQRDIVKLGYSKEMARYYATKLFRPRKYKAKLRRIKYLQMMRYYRDKVIHR